MYVLYVLKHVYCSGNTAEIDGESDSLESRPNDKPEWQIGDFHTIVDMFIQL